MIPVFSTHLALEVKSERLIPDQAQNSARGGVGPHPCGSTGQQKQARRWNALPGLHVRVSYEVRDCIHPSYSLAAPNAVISTKFIHGAPGLPSVHCARVRTLCRLDLLRPKVVHESAQRSPTCASGPGASAGDMDGRATSTGARLPHVHRAYCAWHHELVRIARRAALEVDL